MAAGQYRPVSDIEKHDADDVVVDGPSSRSSALWTITKEVMVAAIVFIVYILIGCTYYGTSASTQWNFSTAVYFIMVSITGVGFGDYAPDSSVDKFFTMIYITTGMLILAHKFSKIGSLVTDELELREKDKPTVVDEVIPEDNRDIVFNVRLKTGLYSFNLVILMLLGTASICALEDLSLVDGLFWSFQTSTTIGYGTNRLSNPGSQWFASFYVITFLSAIGYLLSSLSAIKKTAQSEVAFRKLVHHELDEDLLRHLDRDGSGTLEAWEFICGLAIDLSLLHAREVSVLVHRFHELDLTGAGVLSVDTIRQKKALDQKRQEFGGELKIRVHRAKLPASSKWGLASPSSLVSVKVNRVYRSTEVFPKSSEPVYNEEKDFTHIFQTDTISVEVIDNEKRFGLKNVLLHNDWNDWKDWRQGEIKTLTDTTGQLPSEFFVEVSYSFEANARATEHTPDSGSGGSSKMDAKMSQEAPTKSLATLSFSHRSQHHSASSAAYDPSSEMWAVAKQAALSAAFVVCYLVVGCAYYGFSTTRWNIHTSIYFTAVSATTIGYGDFAPESSADKIFTMAYVVVGMLFGIVKINEALDSIADQLEKKVMQKAHDAEKQLPVDDTDIDNDVRLKTLLYLSSVVFLMLLGAASICSLEGLNFVDGLFWAFQTCSTIGYGTNRLTTPGSQWFATFYAIACVSVVGFLLGKLSSVEKEAKMERNFRKLVRKDLDEEMLQKLDRDGSGTLEAWEFICSLAIDMRLLRARDVAVLVRRFKELDVTGAGALSVDDIRRRRELAQKRLANGGELTVRVHRAKLPTDSKWHAQPDTLVSLKVNHTVRKTKAVLKSGEPVYDAELAFSKIFETDAIHLEVHESRLGIGSPKVLLLNEWHDWKSWRQGEVKVLTDTSGALSSEYFVEVSYSFQPGPGA